MSVASILGWMILAALLYGISVTMVYIAARVLNIIRSRKYVATPVVHGTSIVLAIVLWMIIPVLVHASFGGAQK